METTNVSSATTIGFENMNQIIFAKQKSYIIKNVIK